MTDKEKIAELRRVLKSIVDDPLDLENGVYLFFEGQRADAKKVLEETS